MTTGSNAVLHANQDRTKTATNRFVVQPMEFNDAIGGDDPANRGNPTKRTLNRYRNLFTGGAGLIVLEAISIGDTSMARTHQADESCRATPRRSPPSSPSCVRSTPSRCSSPSSPIPARSAAPSPSVSPRSRWPASKSELLSDEGRRPDHR